MTHAIEVTITGRVQGVYFRVHCAEQAGRLGVTGWIGNEPDGSVRGHFEGPDPAVDALVDWCRAGSPRSRVDDVQTSRARALGCADFAVR